MNGVNRKDVEKQGLSSGPLGGCISQGKEAGLYLQGTREPLGTT